MSIPLTVLLIFTLNILLTEFGAADISGAGAALGAVTQLGPLVTVLVVAGAGSTAICADLGARTIREEIDALEVLGIDPIHRLVVPRVVASTFVALLLNGAVITIGLVGGFIFGVYLQNVSAGAYVSTLTLVTGLPEVLISVVKATDLRPDRRTGRLLPRPDRRRRRQGRGHRGQRDAGAVRHRAVRGQRGADHDRCAIRNGALTCRRPRSCGRASRGHLPARRTLAGAPARFLDSVGHVAWFVVTAIGSIGHALRYYRKETLRLIAEIGMGTGAMAVIGGTVAIVGFVTLSGSSLVAIQGFASLGNIGVEAFTGFFAALINVRIAAPVVAGQALAATVGAGATAELGAMRISEEIDALEVMGIKSISYLVSTRIMAGFVVIIPLYAMAIIMSFLSAQVTTTLFYGQSIGTYEHYFRTFLRPDDVFWSFVQAIIISVIVMLNHCYYGYFASGGPVGVGEAVGRSMRASLVAIVCRRPVRIVGALRRRPELQPDGVAHDRPS